MAKLLHLPLNVPGSEQIGQEKGFRHVFPAYESCDYLADEARYGKGPTNDALLELVSRFQPDIIWAQLQETDTITYKTWGAIKQANPNIWLTTWSGDARTYVPAGMQQWLPYFDIFYNDTDQYELYKPHCQRYEFMPIAVDPDEVTDWTHPTPHQREIVFIGNHYDGVFTNSPFRKAVMAVLSQTFGSRFGVYGNGWSPSEVEAMGPLPLKHQGAYYRNAKVVVSVDHIAGILHWSERLVWAVASGTPVVMQRQPGIEAHWGKRVQYFETAEQAVERVHHALTFNKSDSNTNHVLTHHTWRERAETVRKHWEER